MSRSYLTRLQLTVGVGPAADRKIGAGPPWLPSRASLEEDPHKAGEGVNHEQ